LAFCTKVSNVDTDDHLIQVADFSLTSACPMNRLVTARSALSHQTGQFVMGGNNASSSVGLIATPTCLTGQGGIRDEAILGQPIGKASAHLLEGFFVADL
jgi:hypothetical protein